MTNTWVHRVDVVSQIDERTIEGYDVVATDGSIGSIDEHSADSEAGFVVVDTGFWIFGKKRLIPAGVIRSIDHGEEKVHVSMSKEEVKAAPDLDEASRDDDDWYRGSAGNYYDPFAW
jgi:hypothetical protein